MLNTLAFLYMPNQYGTIDDEIKALVAKARSRGEWFYNKRYDRWMTPDEYQNEYDNHKVVSSIDNIGWLREYHLKDPKGGIECLISDVHKSLVELDKFTKRVFKYSNLTEGDRY